MGDPKSEEDHEYSRLIKLMEVCSLNLDSNVQISGGLGKEGVTFLNFPPTMKLLADLEQALFIRKFINRSVSNLEISFQNRKNDLLAEFCDDERIFRELEDSNQLDIKGKF